MRFRALLVVALVAAGCGTGAPADDDDTVDASVDALDAPVNQPPIARAGSDRMVPRNTRVVLDGSASSDPEGLLLTYRWLLVSSPAASSAALSSTTMVTTELVVEAAGTYEVSLVVDDGVLSSVPDLVRIVVNDGMPVANAGPDQSLHWGLTAQLDGSNSLDPDGGTLSYTWTLVTRPAGSAATLTGARSEEHTSELQ